MAFKKPVLEVYPNPGSGVYYVNLSGFTKDPLSLKVMDASGQELFSRMYPQPTDPIQQTLNLELLPNGVYFIIVGQSDRTWKSRIVKQ